MITREAIYKALFERLSTIPGLNTKSRRLLHWDDVPAANQPALFVVQAGEVATRKKGVPATWTLRVEVYLYVQAGNDRDATPATVLNDLLDAVEASLVPEPGVGAQTLGGLCRDCAISGDIETDEGLFGGQAVAIVPIEITAS
jgi:hypothetical protein